MTTTEHINRILAKCRENLALAEKRTQGEWKAHHGWASKTFADTRTEHPDWCEITGAKASINGHFGIDDAVFITTCAGSAEAGWRSTIAAIEWLIINESATQRAGTTDPAAAQLTNAILTAWPEELL